MSRRDAREVALKLIFEYVFTKEEKRDLVDEYTEAFDSDDSSYVNVVYFGVIGHFDDLMEKISSVAEKFSLERLYKMDLSIIMLGLYEILYMESIPYKVSVDEALSLAQKYSTEKSVKYINGVLSKFAR
ncbi:MAG: transcription antitermination factor NusB [Clostridia bacterium]|nr:transcription antitermination factor NusB [Clostridia bacterium]